MIKNQWIVNPLLNLATKLGDMDLILCPPGTLDKAESCQDCGGAYLPIDEGDQDWVYDDEYQAFTWTEYVAQIINENYKDVRGFKSVAPEGDTLKIHATESGVITYFPKRFMNVPVNFVLNGMSYEYGSD